MDLRIKDKVFIITGGGAGIGGGISTALAKEGAIPVIFGRSDLKAEFAKQIYDLQPKTLFIKVDLSNNDLGIENAVKEVVQKFGQIDGVTVNKNWRHS